MSYNLPGTIPLAPIGTPISPQPKPKAKKKKPVVEKATADFYSLIGAKPEPYDKEKFDMVLSLAKRTDFYEEKLGEGRYPFIDRDINEEILNEEMAAKIRRQIYEEILSFFGAEKEVLDIVDPQEIKSNIKEIIELDKKITEAPPPPPKLSKREEKQLEESLDNFVSITTGPGSVIESSDPSADQAPSLLDLGADTVGTGQSALEEAVESGMSQEDTTAVQKMQDVEFAKETLAELKVDRIKRQETLLPPLPPNSEFFTIDKEIDRLFIVLSPSTGRIRKKFAPEAFLKDWEMVRQELIKEEFQEFGDFSTPNEMLFSGIERPAAYEVLKLNEKPTKISDFLKAQKILVDPDLGIYEDHNIKANHKYYYAFRSIEEDNTLTEQFNDGLISYISDPIEVELVNEGNISFLATKPLLLEEEEKKHYVKTFRKKVRIQPAFLQTIPVKKNRDIGNLNDSSFDPKNKFKVRLTSSKTGRKIDLNIKFVKNKFKQERPPEGAKKLADLPPIFSLAKTAIDEEVKKQIQEDLVSNVASFFPMPEPEPKEDLVITIDDEAVQKEKEKDTVANVAAFFPMPEKKPLIEILGSLLSEKEKAEQDSLVNTYYSITVGGVIKDYVDKETTSITFQMALEFANLGLSSIPEKCSDYPIKKLIKNKTFVKKMYLLEAMKEYNEKITGNKYFFIFDDSDPKLVCPRERLLSMG